jgi:hypothetical protein
MLAEAAAEIESGVINADNVFDSLASIGCDWDAVVVAHMNEVSRAEWGRAYSARGIVDHQLD